MFQGHNSFLSRCIVAFVEMCQSSVNTWNITIVILFPNLHLTVFGMWKVAKFGSVALTKNAKTAACPTVPALIVNLKKQINVYA